jgi:hypothetical protein
MTRPLVPLLLLATLAAAAPCVRAGDVTAFVAWPTPSENWGRGYGAALTSTWFQVLSFEGEAARLPGEDPTVTMTSFTGSALLSPSIGFLTPYGGVGIGLFRQSGPSLADSGVLHAFILGAKVKIGPLFLVKGEYRRLDLSGSPLLAARTRYSIGGGISF